jgi:FkbM family methyltransferase
MSFLIPDEEVFLLSGPRLLNSGPVTIRERTSPGSQQVFMNVAYRPEGASSATIEVTWNPISGARLAKGDLVDLWMDITREGELHPGDLCTLRFPLNPREVWDPDFGSVFAASLQPLPSTGIVNAELSVFEDMACRVTRVLPRANGARHTQGFVRFETRPIDPILELNLQLGPPPNRVRIGRLFAGPRYDPYTFNPAYELQGHLHGRPETANAVEILKDFEAQARSALKKHTYIGDQAFLYPFVVMREAEPELMGEGEPRRFPMLVGTGNSLYWYADDPFHRERVYSRDWIVRPGDVVFDCGAHAGQMATIFALRAGPAGRVLAFDPFPQNILQIEAQVRLNGLCNLRTISCGVGEVRHSLTVSNQGQQTARPDNAASADDIAVDIVPLDDFLDEAPTIVKLDVEGAEVAALRGAQRLLRAQRPHLFIEVHTSLLGRFGHTVADLIEAIPTDGYEIKYLLTDRHKDWQIYAAGREMDIQSDGFIWARRLS